MDISKKLKELRESKGFSLDELASKCGSETDTVKSWEDGSIVPSASELIELSKVYGLTMDEMLYNDAQTPEYDAESGTYQNLGADEGRKGLSKGEIIALLIFPVLCGIVYLVLGFALGLWSPGWIVFIMIPIYYILIIILRIVSRKS